MRRIAMPAFTLAVLASIFMSTTPARAASVEEVVAACDKMADEKPGSCNYTTDDKGLGGCTRTVCFYCPADGSRQCHATRVGGQPGKTGKTDIVVKVGTISLSCNRQDEGWCKYPSASSGGR